MAVWSRLTGAIAAIGIGGAGAAAIEPVLEVPRQKAWSSEPNRVLDLGTIAHLIAQGLLDEAAAEDEAARNGFRPNRLKAMVQVSLAGPPVAEALQLWRRGKITEAQARHALAKARIEQQYHDPILELFYGRLAPADVANAIQQGFMPGDGILPGDPGGTEGITPPVVEVAIDPVAEAKADGVSADRLQVLAELAGLPPGPMELLDLWNRGVITETAVERGIREGHTKTKWTSALKQLRHYLLSPQTAATLRLKGWITRDESLALGRLRGANADVMDKLFLAQGRPAAPQQMATAVARGVDGPDGSPMDRAQFEKGIRESDIRPEWAGMLWGIRFAYPPLFQINRLVQAGAIDAATAVEWATKDRYAPEVVTALHTYWSQGAASKAKELTAAQELTEYEGHYIDRPTLLARLEGLGMAAAEAEAYANLTDARRVITARNQVIARIRSEYVAHKITLQEASAALAATGIPAEAQTRLLAQWEQEYDVYTVVLSAAQIKRAYRKLIFDKPTALDRLRSLGWVAADAEVYLDEG